MLVRGPRKKVFRISLLKGGHPSSHERMSVCRRPNCDRASAGDLGFCAEDLAAYRRSRDVYAALVAATQDEFAAAFSIVPVAQRQVLAEYLVAVASEGLPGLPSGPPRSAGLLAAALIAHGNAGEGVGETTTAFRAPARLRSGRACTALGGAL